MKNNLKRWGFMFMAVVLMFSSFSGVVSASQLDETQRYNKSEVTKRQYDKQVKEVARKLEIFYEEAAIKDANGYVIDVNFDILEEKLGPSPEIEQLKQSIQNEKNNNCACSPIQTEWKTNNIQTAMKNNTIQTVMQNNNIQPAMQTNTVMAAAVSEKDRINQCIIDKIKSNYVDMFKVNTLATIFAAVADRNFTLAAKYMVKFIANSNVWAIAAQLLYWEGQCVYQIAGWY